MLAEHDGVPRPMKTSSFAKQPAHAAYDQPVRAVTRSIFKQPISIRRVLIHITLSEQRVADPDDV